MFDKNSLVIGCVELSNVPVLSLFAHSKKA